MHDQTSASLDDKLKDPRAFYSSPASVLAAPDLTDDERLKLLRRWEQDERALVRAGSESPMTDGEQPILADVQDAIRRLQASGAGS